MATINMQKMRYINLLDKAAKVKTTKCFIYNNTIYFAVPSPLISKAIGPSALNVKKIQDKLGKKVRIIKEARDLTEASTFLQEVVSPVKFKSLEIKDNCITITAGNQQNKASLIGRNKRRLEELRTVTQDIFNLELKVI
jgi:transcription antitermination factor NusA-like protein